MHFRPQSPVNAVTFASYLLLVLLLSPSPRGGSGVEAAPGNMFMQLIGNRMAARGNGRGSSIGGLGSMLGALGGDQEEQEQDDQEGGMMGTLGSFLSGGNRRPGSPWGQQGSGSGGAVAGFLQGMSGMMEEEGQPIINFLKMISSLRSRLNQIREIFQRRRQMLGPRQTPSNSVSNGNGSNGSGIMDGSQAGGDPVQSGSIFQPSTGPMSHQNTGPMSHQNTGPMSQPTAIDLNMEVDDDVIPTGGFALKMWQCDNEGGVCAYQCENLSDTIFSVDCGNGPKGPLYCCDQ